MGANQNKKKNREMKCGSKRGKRNMDNMYARTDVTARTSEATYIQQN